MIVIGRVTRVEPFGVFVKLDYSNNLSALVHSRNITDVNQSFLVVVVVVFVVISPIRTTHRQSERLSHDDLRKRYPIGTTLRLLVFRIDAKKKRISLSLKESLFAAAKQVIRD